MKTDLPHTPDELMRLSWSQLEPYASELIERPLNVANLVEWLDDWTRFGRVVLEARQRLYVAVTVNTSDSEVERLYTAFLEELYPSAQEVEQKLKERLLSIEAEGKDLLAGLSMEVPLRKLRADAALFRQVNLPLLSEELKLNNEYDKLVGAQTVMWEGQEITVSQLQPVYQDLDREKRERAWRLAMERRLADRPRQDELWRQLFQLRCRIAENAGLPDFRAYRWQQMYRFDYSPQDCEQFQQAIEAVVVPAAQRDYERRRRQLGVETLRPWDLAVDPLGCPPLRPFSDVAELEARCAAIFGRLDPQLGAYFAAMRQQGLLDLDNRKDKAPGAYCQNLDLSRLPFIFANSVGIHDDVMTVFHEGGHAFHVFEMAHLPYHQQLEVGMEFAEVASTAMELLAAPYLGEDSGGFYSPADTARARVEHLSGMLLFWPYMAVVDAFQHWVYTHPAEALQPERCDERWAELWHRFMRGIDYSGLEKYLPALWRRQSHIFEDPFYYVDYGLAALGAVQIWRNALDDQANTIAQYRRALSLGGTVSLPQLYQAAGAKFAFDTETIRAAVSLIETTIATLEGHLTPPG